VTAVAPALGLAEHEARPPFAAPAFAAQLLETCAAAAAVGSAIELGVFARVTEGAADPATVAADCGLTEQGAEALLMALAGLGLFALGDDRRFRPALAGLPPWSLALAARDPSCMITAVELPGVVGSTRTAVRAARLDDQYGFVAGDAFDVDWGHLATYDLAFVANLCHLFDDETNVRLLGRVAEALRPAGTVAIVDVLSNERGDGPRSAVLYALGLVLRTAQGGIFSYSTYRRWLDECGFEAVRRRSLAGAVPLSLITARRR
jgi:O-methyltransferase domain